MSKTFSNLTVVQHFPASALTPYEIPKEIFDDLKQARSHLKGEELETALAGIHEKLPPKLKELLAELGVKLPDDPIRTHITLGSYLYDMFNNHNQPEATPIGAKRHERRLTEFAEAMDQEELSIPAWAIPKIYENMNSVEKYTSSAFTLMYDLNGARKSWPINASGLNYFQAIVNTAAEIIIDLAEPKDETSV